MAVFQVRILFSKDPASCDPDQWFRVSFFTCFVLSTGVVLVLKMTRKGLLRGSVRILRVDT